MSSRRRHAVHVILNNQDDPLIWYISDLRIEFMTYIIVVVYEVFNEGNIIQ